MLNTTNINEVSMGAQGLKPTSFDQLVSAKFAALKLNGDEAAMAGVFHPRDLEVLALLKEATTNAPLAKPEAIRDMPLYSSAQLKVDRTVGANNDCSNGYVGDFRQVIVGVRPAIGVRFIVSEHTELANLQVTIVAWLRADVAVGHPEHLTRVVGLRIA